MIGRSNIVGKPMAQLLLNDSCTVTIAHSRTADLPDVVRRADIVVAAVGRPEMVLGDWIKPGPQLLMLASTALAQKMAKQNWLVMWLMRAVRRCRSHHSSAGWRRPDDDCLLACQYRDRLLPN